MAKQGVDGVYSADPKLDPTATKYDRLTYDEALQQGPPDRSTQTAFALCMENKLPMIVFGMEERGQHPARRAG